MREQLGLAEPGYFNYLALSGEFNADGVNDVEEFRDMEKAMDICQISPSDKQAIFRIVSGILHLGNIDFVEGEVANQAGVHEETLKVKLLSRVISTGFGKRGSSYNVPLNVEQARGTRDALAKALYTRMFDWIVQAVNTAMETLAANLRESQILCLGVLDIFGFEIFEKNGFEQFCINYVNEKLQQIFIELTLKSEQEEYQREGIKWTPINYFNNQIVVDLIESKKLQGPVGSHKHFKGMQAQFMIQHYAGSVTYDCDGFTEANKDTLFKDLIQLVQSTNDPFLRHLFPDVIDESDKKRPTTVSFKIKNQSNDLVSTLMRCTPSYVRCIKPNETKRPKDWDSRRVEHQVRYLNLAENIKVRRAGFCYRNTFEKFLRRWSGSVQEGVGIIMQSVSMDPKEWQLGTQKVFIKSPESLFLLEESRDRKYHGYAKVIQRAYRRWKSRKYFLEMRKKAADVMYNNKERKRFSLNREFLGDYLNVLDNPVLKNLIGSEPRLRLTTGNKNEKTLFSDTIVKYDRSFKSVTRELLITERHLLIIGAEKEKDGPNKGKLVKVVKRKIQFSELTGLSLSTKQDDFIVIHVHNDFDNVFENILKTELVTVLSENVQKVTGHPLQITFSDRISYSVKKTRWQSGGQCELHFTSDPSIKTTAFKNSGKTTEIRVANGLPKDSRPNNKSLFESARPATKAQYHPKQQSNAPRATNYPSVAAVASQVQGVRLAPTGSESNLSAQSKNSVSASSNASLSGSQQSLNAIAAAKKRPPPPPAKKIPRVEALYVCLLQLTPELRCLGGRRA
ncbi:Unconventional myosin-Ie [Kappamyces sp. JEL0680]|nr:Unconventional myosin-Ie [Kappamyces sp. JEL0680]